MNNSNLWKVILATLVIYSAGIFTGGLLVRMTAPRIRPTVQGSEFRGPAWIQQRFLERLERELDLTPKQRERLHEIFQQSRERVRILMSLIGPELQEEYRAVQEQIRAELTPQQRVKFDELLKPRTRSSGAAKKPGAASQTGKPPRSSRPQATERTEERRTPDRATNAPPRRNRQR